MKLLFSSDLHLGRTPSGLPAPWREDCRTIRIWERLVDLALNEQPDALLIGGDLLDASNRYWEALTPLQRGAEQLARAKIRLIAVAGNHDADILPRIAERLGPHLLTLLGRGGQWDALPLPSAEAPECLLSGWSFPSTHVERDPTMDFPSVGGDLPVVALLHGDLGAAKSRYAPLSLSRLRALPPQAWLLGHLHTPFLDPAPPWVLMPGSPQPLDSSETGPHFAWSLEIHSGEVQRPVPVPLSTLHYERVTVVLNSPDACTEGTLQDLILRKVPDSRPPFLHLRVRLEAAFEPPEDFLHMLEHLQDWQPAEGVFLDQVERAFSAAPDVQAFLSSHPALRHLEALMTSPERIPADLRARLEDVRDSVHSAPLFANLPKTTLSPEDVQALLQGLISTTAHPQT